MKSFRQHLIEAAGERHHHVIIGRMNPPHVGHQLGVDQMEDAARETGGTSSIFLTRSQDSKRNPLTPEQKKRFAQQAFPGTKVEMATESSPTLLHHATGLAEKGVTHLHIHAGSDRAQQYYDLLNKYNGVESKHGKYKFKQITVHSIGGERGGEGVSGASATKMRTAAASGDREAFHAMAPSAMSEKQKDEMMRAVQGGLKEWIEEGLKKACWDGYEAIGMKKKNGRKVPNCVPVKESDSDNKNSRLHRIKEATHQGRKVTLNKPFRTPGGPKKSAVYVDPDGDGKAKIVRFGDPKLSIKKDQPSRKKSYCARSSGQGNLSKKDSANYWSRRAWDC